MLYEMTSQDVETEFPSFQDVFVSSSREEISASEILGRRFLSFRGKPSEKLFFAIPNLSSILQIDYSSSTYRFFESKSETALTEEFFRKEKIREILEDISNMIEEIIHKEEHFKGIDKIKLLNSISEILNNFTPEQLKIPRNELFRRIRKVIILESVFGILNELSPEEIKDFDEIVKRRPLFK
jgi:hypothetical protein